MAERRSVWALLIDILDRPGMALSNVAAYPRWRWLLPAALAIMALAISLVVMAPLLATQAQQQAEPLMAAQLRQLPPERAAAIQQQMALVESPLVIGVTTAALGTIGLALGWLVQALLIYFGALVAGGDVEYQRLLATAPWLGIPFVIETIVLTVYTQVRGQLLANHGLSYLVSSGKPLDDARNLAYVALGQVTLFQVWHLALVYVLLRVVARLSRGTAFLIMVLYFALLVGVQLVFAAVGRLLTPSL